MKNKRLIIILCSVIFFTIIHAISFGAIDAASLNITTDKEKVGKGEDVVVKVTTDKKIETTTFHLNYDSKTMQFVESNTNNVSVKNYASDGTLRVAYADMSSNGTRNLEFKFQAKDSDDVKQTADIEISDFTLKFVNDKKTYKIASLDDGSTFRTTVKIDKPFQLSAKIWVPAALMLLVLVIYSIVKIVFRRSLFSWKRKF